PADDEPPAIAMPAADGADEEGDMLDEEDDEAVEDDDADEEEPAESGLTRFLHLFVDRADDDDEDEEDEEDEEDSNDDDFASYVDRQLTEGEISMQEPRKVEKVDTEMTQLMAEGLGERTLSRK